MFKRSVPATAGGITVVGTILKWIIVVSGSLGLFYQAFQLASNGEWLVAALMVCVIKPIVFGIADLVTGLIPRLIVLPFALAGRTSARLQVVRSKDRDTAQARSLSANAR